MYSAKSSRLINEYNNIWNKSRVKLFKPSKDTREFSKIHSRDSKSDIPCKVISDLNDMVTIKNLSSFVEHKAIKESVDIEKIKCAFS